MIEHGALDRGYFIERIERNRRLAEQASDPLIRDLHLEYVRLYEQLVDEEATV